MVNGSPVQVASVEKDALVLRDAAGREHRLAPGDPARERVDHAAVLNMHRAQGLTVDRAITVMHSDDRLLNSKSLAYVLSSRARDDMTLHTDNKERLAERIGGHPGVAPHALELVAEQAGECVRAASPAAGGKGGQVGSTESSTGKLLDHLSLALGRVGREDEIAAVQRYAWELKDVLADRERGHSSFGFQERSLKEAAALVDRNRPHAADDLRSAFERDGSLLREAAKGQAEGAFRAMAEEARVRQDPLAQERRFVADWREVAKGLSEVGAGPGRTKLEQRQAGLVERLSGSPDLERALDRQVPGYQREIVGPALERMRDRDFDMGR